MERPGPGRWIMGCLVAAAAGLFALTGAVPTAAASADAGWNVVSGTDTGSAGNDLLLGTACSSTWNCWAVGGAGLGNNSQPSAMMERWNGSSWTAGPDVVPTGTKASLLWGVTCVDNSDCWAVGAQEEAGQSAPVPLAEYWNGVAWSPVAMPDVHAYLFAVTCTGASNCWAVGTSLDSTKSPQAGIIVHWNGGRWSQVGRASSGRPFDQLDSVTCSGPSDCWAVGFSGPHQIQYNFIPGVEPDVSGSAALVEHWNGSTWAVVPTPGPAGTQGQYLAAVTCTDPSDCWAVGTTMDAGGDPSGALVERWNGSAWTVAPSPEPGTPGDLLTAVTCVAASNCWATGATGASPGQHDGSPTPLMEHWNGSSWSVDPSPHTAVPGYLAGVACIRDSACYAAGFAATNHGSRTTIQALIEQLKVAPSGSQGLWVSGADGGVGNVGHSTFLGSARGVHLNEPIVGMTATPDGGGYWLAAADGGVFAFGDAVFHGSTAAITLNRPIVGVAATPDGGGYWLAAADGGVFAFGDAAFYGSAGSITLDAPVVGVTATPDGGGYWLVAADGGVFAFGDAAFYGSAGSITLDAPVVGMTATPDGGGYWLVAADGGVFAFGDAAFYGSVPGQGIVRPAPAAAIVSTVDGHGYWIVGQDGALYPKGDAGSLGSPAGVDPAAPIVGATAG